MGTAELVPGPRNGINGRIRIMTNRYSVCSYSYGQYSEGGFVIWDTTMPWGEAAFIATFPDSSADGKNKARCLAAALNNEDD